MSGMSLVMHSQKPSGICVYLIPLAACVQVLSGLLRVRYQIRRLFICANNSFVTGFSDIVNEYMHMLLPTTAKVSPLVLTAADRPD